MPARKELKKDLLKLKTTNAFAGPHISLLKADYNGPSVIYLLAVSKQRS